MKRSFVGSGMSVGFALAAVVVIGSSVLIHRNIQLIADNEEKVIHTHEVLTALSQIRTSLNAAESSQRGFLITADASYLDRYQSALPEIKAQLAIIKDLTRDNDNQIRNLPALERRVNERLTTLAEGIGIVENNGRDAAREFIQKGSGSVQMDRVRDQLTTMIEEERRLLALRNEQSVASHAATRRTALLSAIVGLSMVLLAWFLSVREVRQRDRMTHLLEDRVRERTAELATVNTSLRQSNRELEQFASVASHDLQEPLRKIEAFGDRLKMNRDTLNDQARDYLDRILSSASRMRTLINDLLSFSRVATRAQPFKPVDMGHIAREVVGDLESRIGDVEGRVELADLPSIEADPTQLRQLLQNLISNALKFHRPGVKPIVRVTSERIESPGRPPQVRLTVADNGIGFEEQYLDRIFEVFQRLHGRNEYEGTGIGLAICRKIVERHGGTISARSTPGEGSTFIATLPVEQSEKEESWGTANPSSS
ncbi:Phytochrome-like protein cph1 [Caulifigura coniformis]|uniref:histidine kinase n=1 Tax=Caulifigura coniformis TaxID=2527983 RepID=A0A517S7L8_9PLAN|nr:sensor histidine kinase [Caulifigura coniformis]QDT52128.1 Phytochrome-like protein cph1 [Caulifigura coniformis]